mmetsp:Transcript_65/g.217  ORF Transcript_65/g.217 Transcript_65/m.217 type:complete len:115 (+) Transcript_65:285-629(+)
MSKKNRLSARKETHKKDIEREKAMKAKQEAKAAKRAAAPPKPARKLPKNLVRGASRNPELFQEAKRIVRAKKKAARAAPKKMDLDSTTRRREAATSSRKDARRALVDKRRAMEM